MGSGEGVVTVSACMSGTRGSDVLSSTGDVLEMSVVRGVGGEGGERMRELGFGFTNPVGTWRVLECLCFSCGGVGGEWVGGLDQGQERWGSVMSVGGVILDYLCRWQVQVSVYCAWRIPAHLRCTQCSILLHLMDICFVTCNCLWQISQIQTRLFNVVGPGLISTSPAFVSSSASHPAGLHGRHAQKW